MQVVEHEVVDLRGIDPERGEMPEHRAVADERTHRSGDALHFVGQVRRIDAELVVGRLCHERARVPVVVPPPHDEHAVRHPYVGDRHAARLPEREAARVRERHE